MLRKILATILVCLFVLSLAACSSHEHKAEKWQANFTEHFKICSECGEKFDNSNHSNPPSSQCNICLIDIGDFGDTYGLTYFNERGDMIAVKGYEKNSDNLIYEYIYEREYYEDGNIKHVKEYLDGVITSEQLFLKCENSEYDEVYLAEDFYYETDGSVMVSKYKENGELKSSEIFDADGNKVASDVYEEIYDENGNLIKRIVYSNDVISVETIYALDENGEIYTAKDIFYDENGEILDEFNYDAEGNSLE